MIALQPHNQKLIDFIKAHQPITTAYLFGSFEGAGNESMAFSKRLTYLKNQGWLLVDGRASSGKWSVNPDQRATSAAKVGKPTTKVVKPVAAPIATPAPASRINIMQGVYRPPPAATYRAGSQDYTRCPSLRQGRAVAYVTGYISL